MIKLLLLSLQVRFSITANRLLLFLKRISGLKRIISPEAYGNYSLKIVFIILGAIIIANKRILVHLLHILFLLILGVGLNQTAVHGGVFAFLSTESSMFEGITATSVVEYMLFVWFIYSFVGGLTSSIIASENHKNDDMMINYFQADAAVYSNARILFARIVDILLFAPTLLIAFAITGLPLWGIATTLILYTTLRLLGETLNLCMYRHIGKHFGSQHIVLVTMLILLAAAVVIPANMNMSQLPIIFANPVTAVISVPVGILAWVYIKKYSLYRLLIKDKCSLYNNIMAEMQTKNTTLDFKKASKWNEGITQADLQSDKHVNKTGFAYLNAIFFDRHRKYFRKELWKRNLIFLALPIVVLLFLLYGMIITKTPIFLFENTVLWSLFNYSPVFFFVIYMVTMGRIVTASVFSNCDIHMLHYPYYRDRETILVSFKARFIVILRYNFIITAVMSFSVITAVGLLYGHMDFAYAGIFFVLLSFIGILFAFNDLFLYYVIQPYDEAGKGKSIVYSIINFIISIIAYMNTSIFQSDFILYTIVIVIITVLYIGIGLVLLLLLAPKNFRLR